MKTSHWHGNVKVTASSGGRSVLGLLLALLPPVGVALAIVAIVAVADTIELVLTVASALVAAGMVAVPLGRLAYEVVADRRADRVEAAWRASWPALPPADEPLRVESERVAELPAPPPRVDLEWNREPVDLDAIGGER